LGLAPQLAKSMIANKLVIAGILFIGYWWFLFG